MTIMLTEIKHDTPKRRFSQKECDAFVDSKMFDYSGDSVMEGRERLVPCTQVVFFAAHPDAALYKVAEMISKGYSLPPHTAVVSVNTSSSFTFLMNRPQAEIDADQDMWKEKAVAAYQKEIDDHNKAVAKAQAKHSAVVAEFERRKAAHEAEMWSQAENAVRGAL